jgi:hypothetical protein
MSRQQRQKAKERLVTRAAIEDFVNRPCRPSPQQIRAVLSELCVRLGYCLPPSEYEAVESDPPTNPLAFAELAVTLEGVGELDADAFERVLEIVVKTFQGAAQERNSEDV